MRWTDSFKVGQKVEVEFACLGGTWTGGLTVLSVTKSYVRAGDASGELVFWVKRKGAIRHA